jgi:hypothetical protein
MSKRVIYIIAGVAAAILVVKAWALNAPRYWIITAIAFTLWAVVIGLDIARKRARAKPPKDGPEADYHDPGPPA